MRLTGMLSLALTASLVSLGCEKANSSSSTKPSDTKAAEAKKKIEEAAEATAAAARAKRDEYVKEMNKQLDALNVKYDEWKAKTLKAEGERPRRNWRRNSTKPRSREMQRPRSSTK